MTAGESIELPFLERHGPYLAVVKPSGRLSHGRGGALEEVRRRLGVEWRLVHRLDRETSGVLVLAEGLDPLRAAHEAWRGKVRKRYLALVRGAQLDGASGRIDSPILEFHSDRPKLLRRALRACYGAETAERLARGEALEGIPQIPAPGRSLLHPAGRPAATRWERLAMRDEIALVALEPEQGRMHQLRLHVAALGGSILGDRWYGPPEKEPNALRLALHVSSIEWREPPGEAGPWRWDAGTPPEWEPILEWLEGRSDKIESW